MSFLDVIPFSLFRRLATGAHARNAAVLEKIFEQFFDDFSSSPKKPEVLQVIRQVLDDPQYGEFTDEDEISNGSDIAEHLIFNRLRDDGWLIEVKSRRATDVHMPREAHALLSALITLKEELKVDISAEASLIDSGILAAYNEPVDKVMNIASARRQAIQLRRSIDGVLISLHRIEEDLMQSEGLADLLTKFMERFVEKLLLENYRALKTSAYNPMRFQRSIVGNIERYMNDEGQLARAAVALADQKLAPDTATAQAQILEDLRRIRDVFAGLGEKLDLIDKFSHKLERRIATTVRYQETARSVRDENLRAAIRITLSKLDAGHDSCITPLVGIPVPYATATLALPKKARETVEPQTRQPKTLDPADLMRESMMDSYAAMMDVTPGAVAARLREIATDEAFLNLDNFEPKDARDIAILYEIRALATDSLPGLEFRRGGPSPTSNRFVSGPTVYVRRRSTEE
ncbi:MAG TPA: Wadjet anti-phage system protein JetA family protein [Rhizomicrobium sp.]